MRNMKRLMAVAMLAVFATMGAQTAKADGVLLSDNHRDGVLLSDKQASIKYATELDIVSVLLRTVNGVLLSD